mgnify:CR=1 FL=1
MTGYSPYADLPSMHGLGVILEPPEINRTGPGGFPFYPSDAGYYTRGEPGLYYDSPIGAIPTDDDLARNICTTPVQSGWIHTATGTVQVPHIGPVQSAGLGALGETISETATMVGELARHQRRMFYLSFVSTIALATMSALHVFYLLRGK